MRGKAAALPAPRSTEGITPAYAGKSCCKTCALPMYGDHPRLCGEKLLAYVCLYTHSGSPPPMRGKVKKCDDLSDVCGITPAYAGKRDVSRNAAASIWDHPRLCGEKRSRTALRQSVTGSPPPMRGKAGDARVSGDAWGITPAYAGKSRPDHGQKLAEGDHPRLCGEKLSRKWKILFWQGSPPPMRGKVDDAMSDSIKSGITPAYAGKSRSQSKHFLERVGSPPPMRGKVYTF